jgi:hypothetical protein
VSVQESRPFINRGHGEIVYGLQNGCRALLGLIELIHGRDDITPELREVLETNHRIAEAEAALKASESSSVSGVNQ